MPLILLDDPDHGLALLRDSVAGMASRHPGPDGLRRRRALAADLLPDVWAAMAGAGWLGLALPEELGGMGLGLADLVVLAESLGRALQTESFVPLAVFAGGILAGVNRSARVRDLATGLVAGQGCLPVLWQDARGERRLRKSEQPG